ncbi:MAG: VWA domain-containing protein [Saprospiraceae bacterium]|nr:VWA domain-containing protein [Saprospiraceae bacterium]
MMKLSLEHPEYLTLLLALPIFIFLLKNWRTKRQQVASRFAPKATLRHIISSSKRKDRFGWTIIALILIIIALANPQLPGKPEKTAKKSADIILAFDVSKSMLAQDIAPDRLTRAKRWATELVQKLANQRIGLVVFAGAAYMYMPLTDDIQAVTEFINGISTDMASYQGTAIGDAIGAAQQSFSDEQVRHHGLVLITDGEDHDSDALKIAENAADKGLIITTIGVGTQKGGMIPEQTDAGTHFKLDENGQPVRSKLNSEILKEIAAAAHGEYYNLDDPTDATKGVEKMIDNLDKGVYETKDTSRNISLFPWFLLPAFLILWLNYLQNNQFFSIIKNLRKTKMSVTLILILSIFLIPEFLQAQSTRKLMNEGNEAFRAGDFATAAQKYEQSALKHKDFNSVYNEANALYHSGKYKESAEKNMEAFGLAKTPEEKTMAAYNLGNSFYQTKDFSKAIDAYKQALRNSPGDLDAKTNLTKALQQKKQQEQKKHNKNNENKDRDKQQQKQQQQQNQKQQQQQNQNGNQPSQNNQQQGEQTQQNAAPQQMTRQQAENLLRIMKEDEKNTRAKVMKQGQEIPPRSGKDW